MKASEKYLIACVTVMTVAYLWLIRQYARELNLSAGYVTIDESGDPISVVDDDPALFEDKTGPFIVKGLNDGE